MIATAPFEIKTCWMQFGWPSNEIGLAVAGRVNKQIAADIGINEVTVRVHRGQVMRKMGARSLAELVRIADKLMDADGNTDTI